LKKLLYLLLFIPFISFSQETKNVLNIDTIKEEYIKTTDGITYYNGKPYNGVFISNHDNGQLRYKENYKDGKMNGLYESYLENGQLEYKAQLKDGKKNGFSESYYKTGQLFSKRSYKDGKEDGLSESYRSSGQLISKLNYKNGEFDGLCKWYYKDGQLEYKAQLKDGKKNGFSEEYHENGQLKVKANYINGKKNGLFEEYHENGQLKVKANYINGKKNGLFEWYDEKGQLEYEVNYKDGKKNGLWRQYNSNGKLVKNLIYKDDEIVTNLRLIIGDTNIEDVNVYDLEAMVKLFLKDCELNNIKLSSDYKITSTFETLDKGVLALAYGIFNDEEIIIKVNPQDWSNASNPKRWYILYHELGHDVLNLKHGQGGKMMFNYSEKDYNWEDFIKDKDYMFSSMKKE